MKDRLFRIFFGILLGLCVPLLVWVLLVEHLILFIILPIFPIIGVILGITLGLLGKLPPLKIWMSLLIFTVVVAASIGYEKVRTTIMQSRRESIASSIAHLYPESEIIEAHYQRGNGMEVPPNASLVIETEGSYEEVARHMDKQLLRNGWQRGDSAWFTGFSWQKGNYEAFMSRSNDVQDSDRTVYQLNVDFLGSWLTHFR